MFTDLSSGQILQQFSEVQFASQVIGFSSQYTAGDWSAQQALGPPDVYPAYEDNVNAWASLTENGQREFLELGFANARQINKVSVYETLYPGAIDTVYVRSMLTGQWVTVWSGTAVPQPQVARIFVADFPLTAYPVNQVHLAINSEAVPYWNEIDAVSISSPLGEGMAPGTRYYWDIGNDGITDDTTRGSLSWLFTAPGSHETRLSVVNDGVCTSEFIGSVLIGSPPEIQSQPQDVTTCRGDTAVFRVAASGTPLSYQWQKNHTDITDSTRNTLRIAKVALSDSGTYTCVVSNFCGTVTSDSARLTVNPCPITVEGRLAYKNAGSTPMDNTVVRLVSADTVRYCDTTNATGNYFFADVERGNYFVDAQTSKPWGGVNAADALLIMRHFVQMVQLTGVNLSAADADGNGFVNSMDALMVARRFVGMIGSFPAGDWIYDNKELEVTAPPGFIHHVNFLCTGDVDGSYTPPTGKSGKHP